MQFLRLTLCLLLPALGPGIARAESTQGFYAGAGLLSMNLLKSATGEKASRSLFGDTYFPEITFGYRFGDWFPLIGYSLFGKANPEGSKRRGTLRVQVPYVFSTDESALEWKAGLGFLVHRFYGAGGPAELGNGVGRQTYYVPEDGSNARLLYLVGGLGLKAERIRYDFDLIISGVLSARRAFHFSAGAGYVF
ncbi:MAG: hypothetical protein EOP11_19685 [Proteobacteria bacterium]|nr:MAG: hypothetical protein EOP11_19685 [Pseudomonadota bacterium]